VIFEVAEGWQPRNTPVATPADRYAERAKPPGLASHRSRNIDEALVQRRRIAKSAEDSNSVAVSSGQLDQHFRE
jgi:hypothetical protein